MATDSNNLNHKKMKKLNIKLGYALLLLVGVFFFNSCSEDNVEDTGIRLFRPVLNKPLSALNNTVTVSMGTLKTAVSYKVDLYRDGKKLKTVESAIPLVTFDKLLWNTTYSVKAIAIAADPLFNSKEVDYGIIKTERFPSILAIPSSVDIVDIGLNVRWTVSGAAVTTVKVFAAADEELLTPLATYNTTTIEQNSGLKIVKKLNPLTAYTVALYSAAVLRGYETFTTKPALPTTGNILDLRGIDVPDTDDGTFLFDQLTNATSGTTVILDGDQTYKLKANYYFDKSLTIKSGYSLTSGGATIDLTSTGQFEIAVSATISSIIIDGVRFLGTTSKYVFNAGSAVSSTVTSIKLIDCNFTSFRNLIRSRTQWTSGGINQFTVENCILTDFSNAGLMAVDGGSNNTLPNITFKNSTFWKVQKLVNNRATTNTTSLNILDCTFSESPKNGQLIEFVNTTNITNGLIVTNTIFGRGADSGSGTITAFDNPFVKLGNLPGTSLAFSNSFKTNDFLFTTSVTGMSTYQGAITDLWVDPLNGNFKIKDKTFIAKSTAGDPRWRL